MKDVFLVIGPSITINIEENKCVEKKVKSTGKYGNLLNIENTFKNKTSVDHCECTPLLHLKIKKHFISYHDVNFCINFNGIGLWIKIH